MPRKELPAPPLPADLDLSSLDYMPLLIRRLLRSKSWRLAKRQPELGFYMINLWMAAWYEVPAASLENDDAYLCDTAQCDHKRWGKVRGQVLRGFQRCTDGRLYHSLLVSQAKIALDKRLGWRERKRRSRNTSGEQDQRLKGGVTQDSSVTGAGSEGDTVVTSTGNAVTGRDGTGRKKDSVVTTQARHPSEKIENKNLEDAARAMPAAAPRRKNQDRADQQMAVALVEHRLAPDLAAAWLLIAAARDPSHPDHQPSAETCTALSVRERLGWFPDETTARRRA